MSTTIILPLIYCAYSLYLIRILDQIFIWTLREKCQSTELFLVRIFLYYFLIKLQVDACNFIKKENLAQVFSCVNFNKNLGNLLLHNTSGDCFLLPCLRGSKFHSSHFKWPYCQDKFFSPRNKNRNERRFSKILH